MVVVRRPSATVQLSGNDAQAVGELFRLAAEGADVADERRDAIGLVESDVTDTADRGGAGRERRQSDERRGQLCLLYTSPSPRDS